MTTTIPSSNRSGISVHIIGLSLVIFVINNVAVAADLKDTPVPPKITFPVRGKDGSFPIYRVQQRSSIMLNCTATGNPKPTVKWYRQNYRFTDAVTYPNGSIFIPLLKVYHFGQWNCKANNTAGKDEFGPVTLSINRAPVIQKIEFRPGRNVSKGSFVEFNLQAAGKLVMFAHYYVNGKLIATHPDPQMVIRRQMFQTSKIKVLLKNEYGNATAEATVFVYDKDGGPVYGPSTAPPPRVTRPPISCQPYTGAACSEWLPVGHRWAYDATVEQPLSMTKLDNQVLTILNALDSVTRVKDSKITKLCARGMKALVCGRAFPVCPGPSSTARDKLRPGRLCREHCEAVQRLFCPGITSSVIWSALREMDLPSKTLRRYLDRDTPLCKGLPSAVRPQAVGAGFSKLSTTSHCTMVDFEHEWRQPDVESKRAKNRCFVKRGQLYNGTVHQARLSPDSEKLLSCAGWNDTRVASALLRKGYSVVAFPSLRSAGRSCRNPAGLQERPFCVPENPTVREESLLVSCNILSCVEYHEIQQKGKKDEVNVLGFPVNKERFILAIVLLIIFSVFLIFLISYCIYCQYCAKKSKGRSHAHPDVIGGNGSFLGVSSSLGASIASEYDPSDAKSLLLTPNQDYHGKALAEFISPQLQKLEYPRTDIRDITELGQGAFGDVYLVEAPKLNAPNKQVAMKVLKNDAGSDMQIQFLREATLLADLKHDNIVKLLGISLVYKPFCMLMEYMCHGDLNSFLRKHGPHGRQMSVDPIATAILRRNGPSISNGHVFSNGSEYTEANYIPMSPQPPIKLDRVKLCRMAVDISEGMIYLSHQNYVHRDLASRNCLLDADLKVKIADFGLCRHVRRGEDFIDDDHGAMPIRWMPLESILERRFNLDTDVWSFGVLLWELFSFAMQPYYGKTHDEVIEFLQKGSYLDKPAAATDNVYHLMLRCWSRQRRERPTFAWLMRQLSELLRRWSENDRDS